MVTTSASIVYPDSDGQPMSDNTKQFECIVYIKKGLDWLFSRILHPPTYPMPSTHPPVAD